MAAKTGSVLSLEAALNAASKKLGTATFTKGSGEIKISWDFILQKPRNDARAGEALRIALSVHTASQANLVNLFRTINAIGQNIANTAESVSANIEHGLMTFIPEQPCIRPSYVDEYKIPVTLSITKPTRETIRLLTEDLTEISKKRSSPYGRRLS